VYAKEQEKQQVDISGVLKMNNYVGTPEEISRYLWQLDKDKKYKIEEYKEKRSLNSNSYCWVLIGKIADILRTSKDEIYLIMLKKYGQSELVSVLSNINIEGYFKYYEVAGTSMLNNKEFTHYKVFKGSSEYDTREMSILIDGIVQEAKELEIEVLPPEEIERLKSLWG
jgi:hypothetical protein